MKIRQDWLAAKASQRATTFRRSSMLPQETFPLTYFGLEPGTTKNRYSGLSSSAGITGDNEILNLAKAYRLQPGTGWLVPTRILHAPGSLLTYEPQWGSDVLSMFQSMVDGPPGGARAAGAGRSRRQAPRYRFLWSISSTGTATPMPNFKSKHLHRADSVADSASEGYVDKWVVYGTV